MATTSTSPTTGTSSSPAAAASMPGAPVRVMAVTLWGVVGTLLGYGILQTVLKAAALFG